MRVAFVVQRYGLEVNGGAEIQCRWTAEHMSKYFEVEVLTTKACDYITWKDHYSVDEELINGIKVRRFPVARTRRPQRFGRIQDRLFRGAHSVSDELRWLEEEGPFSPSLIAFIKTSEAAYDYFVFFSYRYYHSYYGIHSVPRKSILVPTAEQDPIIKFQIFKELFHKPRAIVYDSIEERAMIQAVSGNGAVLSDLIGVGIEIPERYSGEAFRKKYEVGAPYILYLGRIDENKGCPRLFDYFRRYKQETGSEIRLVLAGSTVLDIPAHPDIIYLGFIGDEDKFNAFGGAELLVMPSFLESLSIVTLEAWAAGKPVLANALCGVLKGQCLRSNGGLFYETYPEFRETLTLLLRSPRLRHELGQNGRKYFTANYDWGIVENKYLALLDSLEKEKKT